MKTVNVTCYLIIKATLSTNGAYVKSTPSVRVAKNKPSTAANEVAIKVNLDLPLSLFQKPQLTASIVIPEESAPLEISAEIQENIAKAIKEQSGLDVVIRVGDHSAID